MSSAVGEDYALVIEGSVMFGFAAAKCVEFAFQNLGIDVCTIVPAYFSSNIFYDHYVGKKLTTDDISDIYESLKKNGLLRRFTIIKNGYLETAEELRLVAEIVADIKKVNPAAIYVCDPVLGDNGNHYETLRTIPTPIYKEVLLPVADIATPNQFEVEQLSGMQVHTEDDALKALQIIHEIGPSIVIMTSAKLEPKSTSTQATIGSRIKDGVREVYRIDFEYIDGYLVGTGDMFTGCFVGYLRKSDDFKIALEQTVSNMQHLCHQTYKHALEMAGPGNKPTFEMLEMRAVQCADFLRQPTITHHATQLM